MNLQLINNQPTMSSLEIAKLTGKRHKNVLRDIRNMLEKLKLDESSFRCSYLDSTGRTLPCFNIPRIECDILISGYSILYRAKIINRWHELENVNKPKPMSLRESYLALAKAEEEKEHLALALENKTIQLDESKQWLSIKRVAQLNGLSWKELNWRELKAVGQATGYATRKIFDANYGMVNAYHMSAWHLIYPSLRLK